MTNSCLLQQNFCKYFVMTNNFVATKVLSRQAYFCHNFVLSRNMFVATKMILVAAPASDIMDIDIYTNIHVQVFSLYSSFAVMLSLHFLSLFVYEVIAVMKFVGIMHYFISFRHLCMR